MARSYTADMQTPTTNGSNAQISAKRLKTSNASCLLTLCAALLELGGSRELLGASGERQAAGWMLSFEPLPGTQRMPPIRKGDLFILCTRT